MKIEITKRRWYSINAFLSRPSNTGPTGKELSRHQTKKVMLLEDQQQNHSHVKQFTSTCFRHVRKELISYILAREEYSSNERRKDYMINRKKVTCTAREWL
jgi:hypothetical protein